MNRLPSRCAALFLGVTLASCGNPPPQSDPSTAVTRPAPALLSASASSAVSNAPPPTPEQSAVVLVELLRDGKYQDAHGHFDETVGAALPADKLQGVWEGLGQQVGALEKVGETTSSDQGGYLVVLVRCKFARAELDTKIAFDKHGKVAGLFFVSPPVPYTDPSYVDRATFEEREVSVGKTPWILPATLSMPKAARPVAAVVLVHGSGPNDRDETVAANKPFKDLAGGLASRGIAVLRYEKRTKVYPKECAADPFFSIREETIADAIAAAELLVQTEGIDPKRIGVLGHSMGGTFAPRIMVDSPHIGRAVVMAGATRPIPDMMIAQVTYMASLDGRKSEEESARLAALRAGKERVDEFVAGKPASPNEIVLGAAAHYWIQYAKEDPIKTALSSKLPMMILQGEGDYQVTAKDDYAAWKAALSPRKNVSLRLYPKLNHLFGAAEGVSSPEQYAQRTPVDPQVIDDVAAFLSR